MTGKELDEGQLDELLEDATCADEEGRRALVSSGSLVVALACAKSAVQLCQWERAEKAARCACAMSVSSEPDRQQAVDGYQFCYNHDDALTRISTIEILNLLLYLARAGGEKLMDEASFIFALRLHALRMIAGTLYPPNGPSPSCNSTSHAAGELVLQLFIDVVSEGGEGWGGQAARLTAVKALGSITAKLLWTAPCAKAGVAELLVREWRMPSPKWPDYQRQSLCALGNMACREAGAIAVFKAGGVGVAKQAQAHSDSRIHRLILLLMANLTEKASLYADLMTAGAAEVLLPYTTHSNEVMPFMAHRCLANIFGGSDDDKNNPHVVAAAAAVPKLCEALRLSLQNKEAFGQTMGADGLVKSLAKVAVNDENKKIMRSEGVLPLLEEVIEKGMSEHDSGSGPVSALAANGVHALLHMSFDTASFDWITARKEDGNSRLLTNLNKLAETDASGRAGRDAGSLLFRLAGQEFSSRNVSAGQCLAPGSADCGRHIMVSYCWQQKEIVLEFCNVLRQMGMEVWRDEEGSKYAGPIGGSTLGAMAEAIDMASSVIVFVSRGYKESANCRLEAEYAHGGVAHGLVMLYVMCEENYTTVSKPERVTGWLGLMVGQGLWYPAWKCPTSAAQAIVKKLQPTFLDATPQELSMPAQDAPLSMEERYQREMKEYQSETEKRIKLLEASVEATMAKREAEILAKYEMAQDEITKAMKACRKPGNLDVGDHSTEKVASGRRETSRERSRERPRDMPSVTDTGTRRTLEYMMIMLMGMMMMFMMGMVVLLMMIFVQHSNTSYQCHLPQDTPVRTPQQQQGGRGWPRWP